MFGLELWVTIWSAHTFCHADWTAENTSHLYNRYCQSYFNQMLPTHRHLCDSSTTMGTTLFQFWCSDSFRCWIPEMMDWSGWAQIMATMLTQSFLWGHLKTIVYETTLNPTKPYSPELLLLPVTLLRWWVCLKKCDALYITGVMSALKWALSLLKSFCTFVTHTVNKII